jgi:hypothetical protein
MRPVPLSASQCELIGRCLRSVADGKLIRHDWEFSTLFGMEAHELQAVSQTWPQVDSSSEVVIVAVNNSLLHLAELSAEELSRHLPYSREQLLDALRSWRSAYPDGPDSGIP